MEHMRTVGLVIENSPDFFLRTLENWRAGNVVVPLRATSDDYRIKAAGVSSIVIAQSGSGWIEASYEAISNDSPAQILFTSGTEGEPKGVVLTHKNLTDVVIRLNAIMKVTSEIREYVGVPIYHSFGFGRCRAVCTAGGRAFLPARGFNPLEINAMLEAGEINAISAVPSLWRILLQSNMVSKRAALQVRWIEIGSQFMSGSEKAELRALFPKAIIVQHYGLTEASRSTFLEVHSASLDNLESVGCPLGDVELRITEDGRISIKGPHVASRLMVSDTSIDPRNAEGWLTTNDLGELRDGYLYYKGRADDVINCGGLKLSPDALEASIRATIGHEGELAVCRIPDQVRGDGILVAASASVMATDSELMAAANEAALAFGVNAKGATHVMRVTSLPRTENGKIKRNEIAKRFASVEKEIHPNPSPAGTKSLRDELGAILGVRNISDGDTFVNLGGDSLRYIQASVALEKHLGYLPTDWEKQPIADLELLTARHDRLSQIEPSVILRAIAIVSVVINHSGLFNALFPIDGAAFMLLLPSGYSFSRFQLQRVIETGKARFALAALPRVILPAMLLIGVQQLRHHEFVPSTLFLYHNYINTPGILSFWFIEVFVQIHLILALLLSIAQLRSSLRSRAWSTSIVALIVCALLPHVVPMVWNTDSLYNLVPHFFLWYFFLGWCIFFAQNTRQRWVNTVLIIFFCALQLPRISEPLWLLIGGLFLNWAPTLRLPTPVTRGISALASSSLYIYTSHFLVMEPVAKAFPQAGFAGPIFGSLVVGVIFWYCFEQLWQLATPLFARH